MFNIVLFQPEIPPNTGNIIRLAANTGCSLYLIGPLGFSMEDRQMRRAGLDYHEYVNVQHYANWEAFLKNQNPTPQRLFALTTKANRSVYDAHYKEGDYLLFGNETAGLPQTVHNQCLPENRLRLPMLANQRSLNLANAVTAVVYEAWRQCGFSQPSTDVS